MWPLTAGLAAHAAHARVWDKVSDFNDRVRASFLCEIMLDLLDLSGYAKLQSELGVAGFWEIVEAAWTQYLGEASDRGAIVGFLGAVVRANPNENKFGLTSRDMARAR